MLVVGVSAALLSFGALADLARICGIRSTFDVLGRTIEAAWLLPLTVDIFAIVATDIWLSGKANRDALRYARRAAWSAIISTIVGNAAHGYLTTEGIAVPWWGVVVVSAAPAVALGALVHLAVLVTRRPDEGPDEQGPDAWSRLHDDLAAEPWARAIRAWSEPVGPVAGPRVDRTASDERIAADLRRIESDRGRKLTRDEVLPLYGIGSGRARKVRELVDAAPRSSAGDRGLDEGATNRG